MSDIFSSIKIYIDVNIIHFGLELSQVYWSPKWHSILLKLTVIPCVDFVYVYCGCKYTIEFDSSSSQIHKINVLWYTFTLILVKCIFLNSLWCPRPSSETRRVKKWNLTVFRIWEITYECGSSIQDTLQIFIVCYDKKEIKKVSHWFSWDIKLTMLNTVWNNLLCSWVNDMLYPVLAPVERLHL